LAKGRRGGGGGPGGGAGAIPPIIWGKKKKIGFPPGGGAPPPPPGGGGPGGRGRAPRKRKKTLFFFWGPPDLFTKRGKGPSPGFKLGFFFFPWVFLRPLGKKRKTVFFPGWGVYGKKKKAETWGSFFSRGKIPPLTFPEKNPQNPKTSPPVFGGGRGLGGGF